jgi:hypothetical protein
LADIETKEKRRNSQRTKREIPKLIKEIEWQGQKERKRGRERNKNPEMRTLKT